MKKQLSIFLLYLLPLVLSAQFYDNTWVLGYSSSISNNGFGLSILDFTNNQLSVGDELDIVYDMRMSNTVMSDINGVPLFYFNNLELFNFSHVLIENGDSMHLGNPSFGYDFPQSALIIPVITNQNQYYVLTTYANYNSNETDIVGDKLFYSIIDMSLNAGQGQVVVKNQLLIDDDLEEGKLTATKHSNGRDWWLIWRKFDSNTFIRFLLSPNGIERLEDQTIGPSVLSGLGQAAFSPDGSKYAIFNTINAEVGIFVHVYDFDRCTGLLSNALEMSFSHDGGAGGLAISPNSRFLYIPSRLYIYQFDLWAEDILASKDTVAVYDGFQDSIGLQAAFFMGQLARDGKIYVSANNAVKSLTVIDYPNRLGLASNVRQHAIELPIRNQFGIPTSPNYRLGPIDGSPCDTLGIDNMPLSNFRADQDSSDYLSFYFQDLSAYEVSDWLWDFGDGSFSQDTSPVHIYQQDGVYPVCLTVSNENGSHTACDTLYLGTVSTSEEALLSLQPQLFPNPFEQDFSFVLNDYYPQHAMLYIYDGLARPVAQQRILHGWNTVNGQNWTSGMYFYELRDGEQLLASGKLVKR